MPTPVFHDTALDSSEADRESYLDGLARLVDRIPAMRDRLVFGSDWQMILIEEGHEGYFNRYRQQIQDRFGGSVAKVFVEDNARRLLGLDEDVGNRARLKKFYADRSMATPAWWRN